MLQDYANKRLLRILIGICQPFVRWDMEALLAALQVRRHCKTYNPA
jgi:hypothetical protein